MDTQNTLNKSSTNYFLASGKISQAIANCLRERKSSRLIPEISGSLYFRKPRRPPFPRGPCRGRTRARGRLLGARAALARHLGEDRVRIVPEPEKRLTPQQPSARHCSELIIQVAL